MSIILRSMITWWRLEIWVVKILRETLMMESLSTIIQELLSKTQKLYHCLKTLQSQYDLGIYIYLFKVFSSLRCQNVFSLSEVISSSLDVNLSTLLAGVPLASKILHLMFLAKKIEKLTDHIAECIFCDLK